MWVVTRTSDEDYKSGTVSTTECFRVEWQVTNVGLSSRWDRDEFILNEQKWILEYEHLRYERGGRYVKVTLRRVNSTKLDGSYTVQAFIEDRDKNLTETFITRDLRRSNPVAGEYLWWLAREDIFRQHERYVDGGDLMFVIIFTPSSTSPQNETEKGNPIPVLPNIDTATVMESLSLDLHQLRVDAIESDVTFECEGRSFPVHKALLSARSAVFAAMFRSNMMESRSGVIQIKDMEASVLDQLLQFAYTGKLPDLPVDTVPKLYAAADKYDIELLKKLCAKYVAVNLTKENACEVLVLADTHGDKDLKEYVVSFIVNAKILRDKNIWFEFHKEHPMLASEVIHEAYDASLCQ